MEERDYKREGRVKKRERSREKDCIIHRNDIDHKSIEIGSP